MLAFACAQYAGLIYLLDCYIDAWAYHYIRNEE